MDLIAINMRETEPLNLATCQLMSTKLDWLKVLNPDFYDSLPIHAIDHSLAEKPLVQVCTLGEMSFDYLIGSDIVYWPSSIQPLMNVLTVWHSLLLHYIDPFLEEQKYLKNFLLLLHRASKRDTSNAKGGHV
jgi:hypothetical protein